MTSHIERRTVFTPWRGFASAIAAGLAHWRARRIERTNIEALEKLDPKVLEDIGVEIVRDGSHVKAFAFFNPHAIAMDALTRPKKRGGF